jgi:hypothetical protein
VENYGFSLALPEYCSVYLDGLDFGGSSEVRFVEVRVLVVHCLNIVRYPWPVRFCLLCVGELVLIVSQYL